MRKRGKSSCGSLDSLLDTMTNVVGILVILMVVTQLGVGDAVKRISANVRKVSAEELEQAKQEAAEVQAMLDELNQQKTELDSEIANMPPDDVARQRQLIAELKRDVESLAKATVDPEKLRKEVKEREATVKKIEEEIRISEEQLATLKALLETTSEPGPGPPPKVISLPNPRPAPKGAQPVQFICRKGRIALLDQEGLQKLAQKNIDRIRGRDKEGTVNCARLIEHFEKNKIGDQLFRLKAKAINGVPYLVPEMTEKGGDTIEEMQKPRSRYQNTMRRMNKQQQYAKFLVWADSYDTYLEARKLTHDRGLAAGWIPYDVNAEWRMTVGVPCTCSDQPPPPKPKPVPAAPTDVPKRPPLPADDID